MNIYKELCMDGIHNELTLPICKVHADHFAHNGIKVDELSLIQDEKKDRATDRTCTNMYMCAFCPLSYPFVDTHDKSGFAEFLVLLCDCNDSDLLDPEMTALERLRYVQRKYMKDTF